MTIGIRKLLDISETLVYLKYNKLKPTHLESLVLCHLWAQARRAQVSIGMHAHPKIHRSPRCYTSVPD
jgi:hypothetical protein